jgi:ABC-type bacteriocin/lantibiotic exporter with double-glycine peptidase domain
MFVRLLLVFQILILMNGYRGSAQRLYYVGIPNSKISCNSSTQEKPQWCWAASIQMILNYYNIDIDQEQIVKRTYGSSYNGELQDRTANIETIHLNLNHIGVDRKGTRYIVNAKVGYGAPTPALLIEELSQKHPVLIGYKANFGGHVVVITAVSYYETNRGPVIQTIIVRDSNPEFNDRFCNGRVEYEAATLASRIEAYWFVRVLIGSNDF